MRVNARRFIGDVLLGISGMLILVLALVLVDTRFREQLAFVAASGSSPTEFSTLGERMTNLSLATALLVTQFARQQMAEHTHLTVFAVVAFVLCLAVMRL